MNISHACLVSFVTALAGRQMTIDEIHTLDHLAKLGNEAGKASVNGQAVAAMLDAIKKGSKIEAIREHRAMTGYGLKESKDEIEKYWPHPLTAY